MQSRNGREEAELPVRAVQSPQSSKVVVSGAGGMAKQEVEKLWLKDSTGEKHER